MVTTKDFRRWLRANGYTLAQIADDLGYGGIYSLVPQIKDQRGELSLDFLGRLWRAYPEIARAMLAGALPEPVPPVRTRGMMGPRAVQPAWPRRRYRPVRGNQLQAWMQRRGLSGVMLAEALGYKHPKAVYYQMRQDEVSPSCLARLVQVFGPDVLAELDGEGQ